MPMLGETVAASNDILKAFGGKGANQAIACARLADGVRVQMLGQVGSDQEGTAYLEYLSQNQVDNTLVKKVDGMATGQAYILSQQADNSIIIVGGANQEYGDTLSAEWTQAISGADILLMQREIPERINLLACKVAKDHSVTTILDMGGSDTPLSSDLLKMLDYISPNETELSRIISAVTSDNLTP
jgi:ribokinase